MKKIDAHLHLAKVIGGYCGRGESRSAGNGKVRWANGDEYQLLPQDGRYGTDNFTAEAALGIMKTNGVEKAVLMEGSLYGFQNAYYEEILKKYPDTFCPCCTVDPFMTGHMQTMERFFGEVGFRAAKFEVSTGGGLMGANGNFVLDDKMMPIFELINRYKGIVVLDLGDPDMESHQINAVRRVAEKCPDLTIVCCHLLAPNDKWHDVWTHELGILKKDNIYLDISSVPKIVQPGPGQYPYNKAVDYIKEAIDILGVDRFMWGTDAPYAATVDTYEHLTDYLADGHGFDEATLEKLYYKNAAHVYFGE